MRALLFLAVFLIGCGPPPKRECTGEKCDRLSGALGLAETELSALVGYSAARAAFDIDIRVEPVDCLEMSANGTCLRGRYLPTGIVIDQTFMMLLHEGFHSAWWSSGGGYEHGWGGEWRVRDQAYRTAMFKGLP